MLAQIKVMELSCMGGWYPASRERRPEWNFKQDAEAGRAVSERWPTPIDFSDAGKWDIGYPSEKARPTSCGYAWAFKIKVK